MRYICFNREKFGLEKEFLYLNMAHKLDKILRILSAVGSQTAVFIPPSRRVHGLANLIRNKALLVAGGAER